MANDWMVDTGGGFINAFEVLSLSKMVLLFQGVVLVFLIIVVMLRSVKIGELRSS